MYDELVKRLRAEANEWCANCCYKQGNCICDAPDNRKKDCDIYTKLQAADAIEELQQTAEHYHGCMNEWFEAAQEYEAAAPKWIPVTERLPEDRHDVLVYAGVMFPYITVGYYDGLWKFSFNDEEIAGSADYWMPLPQPPKEE